MKRVLGYDADGHTIWSENVPASPTFSGRHRGELVRGDPGPRDRELLQQRDAMRRLRKRQEAGEA